MPEPFIPTFEDINQRIYDNKLEVYQIMEGALDSNWLSEYEYLYKADSTAAPWAYRIYLKEGDIDKGFIHRRANNKKVPHYHSKQVYELSEMYIAPPSSLSTADVEAYIKCSNNHNSYGREITCVPFIMPNPNFGVCAQASVWISMKILENCTEGSVTSKGIPEIQKAAVGHPFADSNGLPFDLLARLFKMNGCEVFDYQSINPGFTYDEMFNVVYAYVESGLPVVLGVDVGKLDWWDGHEPGYHTIVLIGHTLSKKTGQIHGFLVHDESKYPYLKITKSELKKAWDIPDKDKLPQHKKINYRRAIVGVPPSVKVGYEATFVHKALIDHLHKEGKIKSIEYAVRPQLIKYEELRHIIFTSGHKDEFRESLLNGFITTAFPQWVWLLTFFKDETKRVENEICGGIIFDASENGNPIFIFFNDGEALIEINPDYQIDNENGTP